MNSSALLTLLTLCPVLGGLLLVALPANRPALVRRVALAVSFVSLALTGLVFAYFLPAQGGVQLVHRIAWVASLGIDYHVAADGVSMVFVLLTALLVPMAIAASDPAQERSPLYFGLVLFLQGGLFGTFTALNFVHWFLFWELSLIPAFFLVRLWGGPGRAAASMQFFVYTMVGSVALLLAFLLLFLGTGTFDFAALATKARAQTLAGEVLAGLPVGRWFGSPESCITVAFLLVLLGFAVKLPVVPFHTWLPTTYAEAPTPVTMLLTGLMSKMGVYGLLRIVLPIFGAQVAAHGTALLGFAVATIVLSAAAACVQTDLKRMLGYSSINHLGYCLLGVAAVARTAGLDTPLGQERVAALNGVSLQIFNHGLTAAALFCFVALLERRAGGGRALADFGGLRQRAPVLCGLMGISLFASLGLPGLNGFIGEFLIFKGVFALTPWAAVASTLGLLLTAVFLLKLLATVFYGPLHPAHHQTADLTVRERCLVVPAVVVMFALGLWPQLLLQYCNPCIVQLLTTTGP